MNERRGAIGVVGAGAWGTALAVHLARSGHEVRLLGRSPERMAALSRDRVNHDYLPGVSLPPSLFPTSAPAHVSDLELVLLVVPSHGFRAAVRELLLERRSERPLIAISGTKGIEADTLARMSQVCFEEGLAAGKEVHFAVVSGPSFAAELANGHPTAAVVASEESDLAERVRNLFSARNLRLYSTSDVAGVELAGASKNVVAIGAGLADGLGYGHNTQAALITRGLHEITRLGLASGGRQRTFSGLAGLGDLVLTCTGSASRNRRVGLQLAAGKHLPEILQGAAVAEGVRNSLTIRALAEHRGVEMPIAEAVVEVLHRGKPAREAVEQLMRRELKAEGEP